MAAFLALGKTLDQNIIGTIFSFLDESSLVISGTIDASDIGNMDDVVFFDHWHASHPRINRYTSVRLIIDSMEQAAFQHQLVC